MHRAIDIKIDTAKFLSSSYIIDDSRDHLIRFGMGRLKNSHQKHHSIPLHYRQQNPLYQDEYLLLGFDTLASKHRASLPKNPKEIVSRIKTVKIFNKTFQISLRNYLPRYSKIGMF